jgi:hypothetical protein
MRVFATFLVLAMCARAAVVQVDSSDRVEVEKGRPLELSVLEGGSVLQDLSLYRKPK